EESGLVVVFGVLVDDGDRPGLVKGFAEEVRGHRARRAGPQDEEFGHASMMPPWVSEPGISGLFVSESTGGPEASLTSLHEGLPPRGLHLVGRVLLPRLPRTWL